MSYLMHDPTDIGAAVQRTEAIRQSYQRPSSDHNIFLWALIIFVITTLFGGNNQQQAAPAPAAPPQRRPGRREKFIDGQWVPVAPSYAETMRERRSQQAAEWNQVREPFVPRS